MRLTEREKEILLLVAQGLSNSQIAKKIYVSVATVKADLQSSFRKLHVENRLQAAVFVSRYCDEI